jgi:hypothetical protein
MSQLIVFFLFQVKHALLSNIVDVGYSESRSKHHTLAVRWLFLSHQMLLEAIGSIFLIGGVMLVTSGHSLWRIETMLLAEAMGQVIIWSLESRATYSNMLTVHVLSELSFTALYILLVAACYPF